MDGDSPANRSGVDLVIRATKTGESKSPKVINECTYGGLTFHVLTMSCS